MGDANISRLLLMPFLIGILYLVFKRLYQDWHKIGKRMLIRVGIAAVLTISAAIISNIKPVTWWTYGIRIGALHYKLLFVYLVAEHLITKKPFLPVWKSRMFYITTAVTILVFSIDSFRLNNLGLITDSDALIPQIEYFISYLISYGFMLCISLNILKICLELAEKDEDTKYKIRCYMFSVAYLLIAISEASVIANVIFAMFNNYDYRAELNEFYHGGKPFYFLTQVFALIIPDSILEKYGTPLDKYFKTKRQLQIKYIEYLHQRVITAAPTFRLPSKLPLSFADMLMEIADVRMLVRSHKYFLYWLIFPARREAQYLYDHLQQNKEISKGGPYKPLRLLMSNETRFNAKVGRYLYELEQSKVVPAS